MPKRAGRRRRNRTPRTSLRPIDTPNLSRVVARLAPEVLHQLIDQRGLDACAALIAAASPQQVAAILDLDLWRPPSAGRDDRFDPHRFGLWIEALMDEGEAVAARVVAEMDRRLAVAGLSRHLRVFDAGVLATITSGDAGPECEIGGYCVRARTTRVWDAIVGLLIALCERDAACFHALMHGCRRLSNSTPEPDGFYALLLEPEQLQYDLSIEREHRRAGHGYLSPGDARAFLQTARQPRLATSDESSINPITAAYFRALGEGGAASGGHRVLAFLANALLAGCSLYSRTFTAGEAWNAAEGICNLGVEARAVRLATIELDAASPPTRALTMRVPTLADHDVVIAFETGWRLLHKDVGMHVAEQLIATLMDVHSVDSAIQRDLYLLRRELVRHRDAGSPWLVRDALDVIALLDMPAWACLTGLLSECPVLPTALPAVLGGRAKSISATAFECFASLEQIRLVHDFTSRLREWLY
jgi:uncharacterized protein DUF6178